MDYSWSPLFDAMSSDAADCLTEQARTLEYGEQGVILEEGTIGDDLFLIQRGKVEIYRNFGKPDQRLVKNLGVGDFFGESALFLPMPRTATSVAVVEPTVCLVLSNQDFERLLARYPGQYAHVLRYVASLYIKRLSELGAA